MDRPTHSDVLRAAAAGPFGQTPAPVTLPRRSFLRYVGYGFAAAAMPLDPLGPLARAADAPSTRPVRSTPPTDRSRPWVTPDGRIDFTPVDYPLPLPGDAGDAASDVARLTTYEVRDDLVLPDGFGYDVVATWGDRFGPSDDDARQVRFGFNCDYTTLVPIDGTPDEFYLVVNHEYISARTWLAGVREAHGVDLPMVRVLHADTATRPTGRLVIGETHFNAAMIDLEAVTPDPDADVLRDGVLKQIADVANAGMADLGVSVLRVRRQSDGRVVPVIDAPDHRRVAASTRQNVDPAHAAIRFTGPAATVLDTSPGTFSNCSGGDTPWGTVLTCEENFQDQVPEHITPAGDVLPGQRRRFGGGGVTAGVDLPVDFEGLGLSARLDGRTYGWVGEIDPTTGRLTKHSMLGRFRHENVAIRCVSGERLAAYMGDDRRGGHVWKFVSRDVVSDPADPANARLFDDGTLYVARFEPDYTGRWVPLEPDTPIRLPDLEFFTTRHCFLPRRPEGGHVAVGTEAAGERRELSLGEWIQQVETFAGQPIWTLTLGDLVTPRSLPNADARLAAVKAVLLMDAHVFANCVGGTPTSRPEDVEVHPHDRSVYVAFTDSTGGGDGSPDARIFPDSDGTTSRQYGAIYRLAEHDDRADATAFTWGKFVSSGEVAEGGGGFACADNLAFDPDGNLWMVTDISTAAQNFPVGRTDKKDQPGGGGFAGVFGNNALFCIPTAGPRAGLPHCFAIGPMESELTGPTFLTNPDGSWTLVIAVQHPGELGGVRGAYKPDTTAKPTEETRVFRIAARDGTLFDQTRLVPIGSNFPAGRVGDVPKPTVVCVTRRGYRQ